MEFILFSIFIVLVIIAAWVLLGGSNSMNNNTNSSRSSAHKISTFKTIANQYRTIEQVQEALRTNGLESCNLIVGIDFTKSNETSGKKSFGGKSLHNISGYYVNPYQQVIDILGRTLESFDEDNVIKK